MRRGRWGKNRQVSLMVEAESSKTKGVGEQGAAGYCPKILLLKKAKIFNFSQNPAHVFLETLLKLRARRARMALVPSWCILDMCLSPGPEWPLCLLGAFSRCVSPLLLSSKPVTKWRQNVESDKKTTGNKEKREKQR